MSAVTATTTATEPGSAVLDRVSLGAGVLAAALTMLLSILALALAAVALATGTYALTRRHAGRAAAAGTALGASTVYLILLEVLVLGH
jgi:hypothetical protein